MRGGEERRKEKRRKDEGRGGESGENVLEVSIKLCI